ncbi:hypothetical protein QQS21_000532 [Conoideocrella luteorostrata]|uniref:Peptidase S33 tripeptidyl aminopeptidase-like C-terminal domain-containing protein n=1 Tax=Conoideocrella luteorostrata TaxID=1105319 RepID=A0AAJ0FZ40_9HYPO|nr:hypothetical protein QQS21_000532 [Conoideocrella luteorostrata]
MRLQHQLLLGLSTSVTADPNRFQWDAINATADLQYHDCYTAFKCARLKLPLNWKNSSDPRTVSIAVIKVPAKVHDHDPTFGGAVFTNPGGPGGSGVSLVLGSGRKLQDWVDTPGKKHFEIISFDPRGVGNSRPVADCYPGDVLARDASRLETRGLGGLDGGPGKMAYGLAMADGFGKMCELADGQGLNGGELFEYLGTPNVARDMVEMVDKVDELREKEASGQDDEMRTELKKRDSEDDVPRLQYVGFSYGTILGNYFSALFPERIGRIVLDGVCNTDDYSNGPGWLTNTVDADAVVDKLFTTCFTAGPQACALARSSDKSASDIRTRFWAWVEQLDEAPISGISPSGGAVVLTGSDIRLLLALGAYSPILAYPVTAQLLDSAMKGENVEILLSMVEATTGRPLENACPVSNQTVPPTDRGTDAQHAVLCGDGEDITSKNVTWWQSYVDKQISTSSVFWGLWTNVRFQCSRWRFRANWIFKGPYTTPEPSKLGEKPTKGKPAAPLLFLTNRLDPVTPLSAARAMAKNHPGAGVVIQESLGHCAFAAASSQCTKKIVAEYLDTGKVPDGEATCEADCGLWDAGCMTGVSETRPSWYKRNFPLGI